MKLNIALKALLLTLSCQHIQAGCPFANMFENHPENSNHSQTISSAINREATAKEARRLQAACNGNFVFTTALFEQIYAEVEQIGNVQNASNGDRGRFYGGIMPAKSATHTAALWAAVAMNALKSCGARGHAFAGRVGI